MSTPTTGLELSSAVNEKISTPPIAFAQVQIPSEGVGEGGGREEEGLRTSINDVWRL